MDPTLDGIISDLKEQILFLREMGVETMNVAAEAVAVSSVAEEVSLAALQSDDVPMPEGIGAVDIPAVKTPSRSRLASLPSLGGREKLSRTQNAPVEKIAGSPLSSPQAEPSAVREELFSPGSEPTETIDDIRADIGDCTRCPLFAGRTQIVHSTGNLNSRLMFVGEAPGADEDAQGFPFVGRAGQLLTKIIEGIGLKREDVFIGNINRCRPPGNRAPTLPEAETCKPFLLREIAIVRPKAIVVMGNTATQNLLKTKIGITRLRGEFQDYYGVKVMPTFHPAYLLRDPNKKREVWEDMKKVRDYLRSQDDQGN